MKNRVEEEYVDVLTCFPEVEVNIPGYDLEPDKMVMVYSIEHREHEPEFTQSDAVLYHLNETITKRCKYCVVSDKLTDYSPDEAKQKMCPVCEIREECDQSPDCGRLYCGKYNVAVEPESDANLVTREGVWCRSWTLDPIRYIKYLYRVKKVFTGATIYHIKATTAEKAEKLVWDEDHEDVEVVESGSEYSPFIDEVKLIG